MPPESFDAASWVFNYLKTADAADVYGMLVTGSSSVHESGDLTGSSLNTLEEARRVMSGGRDLALALVVQDDGEHVLNSTFIQQRVVVRVYDRARGYRNIRRVREQVVLLLDRMRGPLVSYDADARALLTLAYRSRTGHQFSVDFSVEYESILFEATIQRQ